MFTHDNVRVSGQVRPDRRVILRFSEPMTGDPLLSLEMDKDTRWRVIRCLLTKEQWEELSGPILSVEARLH